MGNSGIYGIRNRINQKICVGSKATRKKISASLKGHAVSKETRRKISEANIRFRQKG